MTVSFRIIEMLLSSSSPSTDIVNPPQLNYILFTLNKLKPKSNVYKLIVFVLFFVFPTVNYNYKYLHYIVVTRVVFNNCFSSIKWTLKFADHPVVSYLI